MGCVGVCEGDPVKGWLLIKKKIMTPAPALAPEFSGRAGKTLSPAPWPRPPILACRLCVVHGSKNVCFTTSRHVDTHTCKTRTLLTITTHNTDTTIK